jgi:hypothetical protein
VRSLEAIAIENEVEGCVREKYGALLATWQAQYAVDSTVRLAFAKIASDETSHAAFSSALANALRARLPPKARRRVAERGRAAWDALAHDVDVHTSPEGNAILGLPSRHVAKALVAGLRARAA